MSDFDHTDPDVARLMQPVAEAFTKLAERITLVFEQVDWDALTEILGRVESAAATPDVARLRHGHAAVCPRHGPAKGGTCRRCQRGQHAARF